MHSKTEEGVKEKAAMDFLEVLLNAFEKQQVAERKQKRKNSF